MAKTKTHYEQVPVTLAKEIIARQLEAPRAFLVTCGICGTPVELEDCKIDERGDAVHEKCYVSGLRNRSARRATTCSTR
jgi:hypothetical protein